MASTRRKKRLVAPHSRGLEAAKLAEGAAGPPIAALRRAIRADGGSVLGVFRDPLGGHWQVLAGLPVDRVEPTPFQRDVSESHVSRLADVIDRTERFLDPIIAVRSPTGGFWTPNGSHRLSALRQLGARSVTALVLPDAEVAYRILALNTEKAHNLREKSLEVVRMARSLAEMDPRPEKEFALEFEEPAFITLGLCYERRGRFSGGAYHPVLRRVEAFLATKLPGALQTRAERAIQLLELDDVVVEVVKALKARGFESPYLKSFVVARINPLRFRRGAKATFDEAIRWMLVSARRFDPSKIQSGQIFAPSGRPED